MGQCQALRSPPSPLSEITWDPPIHGRVGHLGPPSSSTSINLPQFELNPLDKAEDVNPPPPTPTWKPWKGRKMCATSLFKMSAGSPSTYSRLVASPPTTATTGGCCSCCGGGSWATIGGWLYCWPYSPRCSCCCCGGSSWASGTARTIGSGAARTMGSGAARTMGMGWKPGCCCCCWYCWGGNESGGAPPSPGSDDDGGLYCCPYCCGTCGFCCGGTDAGGAALDASAAGRPPDAAEVGCGAWPVKHTSVGQRNTQVHSCRAHNGPPAEGFHALCYPFMMLPSVTPS